MKRLPSAEPAWEIRGEKTSQTMIVSLLLPFHYLIKNSTCKHVVLCFQSPAEPCVTTQGLQDPAAFQALEKQKLMDVPSQQLALSSLLLSTHSNPSPQHPPAAPTGLTNLPQLCSVVS